MENHLIEIVAVVFGLIIRFGIPIALTVLFSWFLKWLDQRWQAEAEAEAKATAEKVAPNGTPTSPIPCWEILNCPPRLRSSCQAYNQKDVPCWEIFRTNGRLKPACRNCQVMAAALAA